MTFCLRNIYLIIGLLALTGCQLLKDKKGPENLQDCQKAAQLMTDEAYSQSIPLFLQCIDNGNLTKDSLIKTYRRLAISYRKDGDDKKALHYTNKVIDEKPADIWKDFVNRGNLWADKGQYDKALQDYQRAQEIFPAFNEAFYNRGAVYERLGEYHKARDQFVKAWQHGLRSQLLYERLRAYGLIKSP